MKPLVLRTYGSNPLLAELDRQLEEARAADARALFLLHRAVAAAEPAPGILPLRARGPVADRLPAYGPSVKLRRRVGGWRKGPGQYRGGRGSARRA